MMKSRLKNALLAALALYAVLSLLYITVLSATVTDEAIILVTALLGKQLAVVFVLSAVIGGSLLIFALNISAVAKRLIHIAVNYLAVLGSMLLLISSDANAAQKLVYIVITTVAFGIVYALCCFAVKLIRSAGR